MYNAIVFDKEEQHINDFLALPKLLYAKKEITQNAGEERKILEETHVMNKYFRQHKILAYNQAGQPCGRCIVTVYPDGDTAYIGYFECVEDPACAKAVFDKAEECSAREGFQKIVGPLDSSFWMKYRLKTDSFDSPPYTGEPYNKPYYAKLFEDNGYSVMETWVSNRFGRPPLFIKRKTAKYKERLDIAERNNYKIVNVKSKDFDQGMDIIYSLISETFKDFVTFRPIAREDFKEIFKDYKLILDYHLVKLVYYEGEPVAFVIVIPDYQNRPYRKMTPYNILRILLKKLRSGNYVGLYMGVKKEHRGLGKALAQKVLVELYIRRSKSIGALITKGKITEKYFEEQVEKKNTYVLYEKAL